VSKSKEQKTVLVSGHFNVIHPGHLRLFRFAKECGDLLIVAVESDRLAGTAAHVPQDLRLEGVLSNSFVDEAIITDASVQVLIERLLPDIVVKGKEHEDKFNPEVEVLRTYGGKLLFSSGEALFSSLDLIRREFSQVDPHSIRLPLDFMKRHQIEREALRQTVKHFAQLKVVVIGDLIIDEYITCQPLGMSEEDPTIVVTPLDSVKFVGGAGIVAAHAAGLGAQVTFLSVVGPDETGDFGSKSLEAFNVNAILFRDPTRPTTLKQRYRSKGKSLLRVSHLHQGAISAELQQMMLEEFSRAVFEADLVVFSDFNYGCLPQTLVDKAVGVAKQQGILTAADSQSSSQVGDISRFKGMDLITPTEREARISTKNHEDGLVILAQSLRHQASARNVLLKMGEEGVLVHADGGAADKFLTDQVPALNAHPKDVAGAGDSLLIACAMALASGANIWQASCVGSLAAAIQVGRVGNTPVLFSEVLGELTR
jgi:rfaE bifunctional protein kinase chain/domain